MAKKVDQFEKFRNATLGSGSALSGALSGALGATQEAKETSQPKAEPADVTARKSKNADRRLVSFHIDNATFIKLGQLKFDTGSKYDELYNEAIIDLLKKYHRL